MIDFSFIKTSDKFTALCEDILKRKGFVVKTSREQEINADIIAEASRIDLLGFDDTERVLVDCKHFINVDQIVRQDHVKNIIERTTNDFCSRYLLITDTVPSISVNSLIEDINKNPSVGIKAAIWTKDDLLKFISDSPEIIEKYFKVESIKGNNLNSEETISRYNIIIHAHPDFTDELKEVISVWNECQKRIEFILVKPSQLIERDLLKSGEMDSIRASEIADIIRKEAGFASSDGIIQFCEKRLYDDEYYQLFACGTTYAEDPPDTATISLQYMRTISKDTGNQNKYILSMILITILGLISTDVGLESHEQTQGCIMDFDEDMTDIIYAINKGFQYCEVCRKQIIRNNADYLISLSSATKDFLENINSNKISERFMLRDERRKEVGEDYSYDIALSFAGEDREIAKALADRLLSIGIHVFYDGFEKARLWGQDLYAYLSDLYRLRAKYCVMLISKNYANKLWTNHEREAAQARAFKENRPYILPLRIDDTEIPGILSTTGYINYREESINSIACLLKEKLGL